MTIADTWWLGQALHQGRWVAAFISPENVHVMDTARQADLLRRFAALGPADFPLGCYREVYLKSDSVAGFSVRHTATLRMDGQLLTSRDPVQAEPVRKRPPPPRRAPPRRVPPRKPGK